jgi:hypothetical protein
MDLLSSISFDFIGSYLKIFAVILVKRQNSYSSCHEKQLLNMWVIVTDELTITYVWYRKKGI